MSSTPWIAKTASIVAAVGEPVGKWVRVEEGAMALSVVLAMAAVLVAAVARSKDRWRYAGWAALAMVGIASLAIVVFARTVISNGPWSDGRDTAEVLDGRIFAASIVMLFSGCAAVFAAAKWGREPGPIRSVVMHATVLVPVTLLPVIVFTWVEDLRLPDRVVGPFDLGFAGGITYVLYAGYWILEIASVRLKAAIVYVVFLFAGLGLVLNSSGSTPTVAAMGFIFVLPLCLAGYFATRRRWHDSRTCLVVFAAGSVIGVAAAVLLLRFGNFNAGTGSYG